MYLPRFRYVIAARGGVFLSFRASSSRESGKRLGHEALKVRDEGTKVLLLQPTRADLEVMGLGAMFRYRGALNALGRLEGDPYRP